MSKSYKVSKITEGALTVNGTGENFVWKQANVLEDFCSPWDSEDIKKIEFRALWDKNSLYFNFKVRDSKIHIHESNDTNQSINNSDRLELFFK
jgi:hypothetical protein